VKHISIKTVHVISYMPPGFIILMYVERYIFIGHTGDLQSAECISTEKAGEMELTVFGKRRQNTLMSS
jgi:hypothetical protein